MANSQKGEVGLTLGGTEYTFKLGTSALIELQELFSAPDVAARLALKVEAGMLRDALLKYGQHAPPCKGKPCRCGYAQAVGQSVSDDVAPVNGIFAEVGKGRVKYVRAFLWAGLRKYHPTVTLEDVSDLLDGASETEIQALLVALGVTTAPDPKDIAELNEGASPNPRKAQRRTRGTGETSTSKLAASA